MAPPIRIETRRLVLRPLDGPDARALVVAGGGPASARNVADGRLWIAGRRLAGDLLLAAMRGRALIGVALLRFGADGGADGGAELGYWVGPAHRGQGYAVEIAAAVAEAAFARGASWLCAVVEPGNAPSRRVLLKLGFVADGDAHPAHEAERYRLAAPSQCRGTDAAAGCAGDAEREM